MGEHCTYVHPHPQGGINMQNLLHLRHIKFYAFFNTRVILSRKQYPRKEREQLLRQALILTDATLALHVLWLNKQICCAVLCLFFIPVSSRENRCNKREKLDENAIVMLKFKMDGPRN
jgi:hypothetical protein